MEAFLRIWKGPINCHFHAFYIFWSGFKRAKTKSNACKTEFVECSFGSPRDGPKILELWRFHADVLVRLDNLDVQIPRVLIIFLTIGMGAHKYPPKLGYGGSGCKFQFSIKFLIFM